MACQIASRLATRWLAEAVEEGRDAAIGMRSYLRGRLGYRNEDLVRFGVAPVRKRKPRATRKPTPPSVDPAVH